MIAQIDSDFFKKMYHTNELTFQQWFGIAVFHYWMCSVVYRLQDDRDAHKSMAELFNIFWNDAETRILNSGIKDLPGKALILGKQQKRFLKQYLGMMFALDEGLVFGDNFLAEAIWRNLFFMDNCTAEGMALLVQYARQQVKTIEKEVDLLRKNAHISWVDLNKHAHKFS